MVVEADASAEQNPAYRSPALGQMAPIRELADLQTCFIVFRDTRSLSGVWTMTELTSGDTGCAGWLPPLPEGAIDAVARSKARIGLIDRDGLIATFSSRLSRDLGFDAPEDLRGLSFASLWHPADRPAVERAFVEAMRGRAQGADVDLGYVYGTTQPARVTFAPGEVGGAVLMTFDWNSGNAA